MKRSITLFFTVAILAMVFAQDANAQLTGIKNIPGDYASIALAITDLNTSGVGAGGVTFNVAANYTETITAVLSITETGTSGNLIVFQKNPATSGANPLITAYTGGTGTPGTAVQDGIWNLVGSDYVTIDGIDLADNIANTTNPSTMEYGYGMFKASVTDGCQNNTIKNCVVTLNRINNATGGTLSVDGSRAINVVNALVTAQTTVVVPTLASGTNSYNKFYSNTLQNCNIGIALIGYAGATPFTLCDFGNDIGGTSLATGNNIINYGGGTSATNPAAGVRTLAQYDLNVSYNTVNNNNGTGVNHVSTLRGIYLNTAVSASATISYNTLSISSGSAASQVSVIENLSGGTAAGNTININNNIINNCNWASATSGIFYGIFNQSTATAANVNINNNTFATIVRPGTGLAYMICNASTAGTALSISNNAFINLSLATTGSVYFIYNYNLTNNMTISNNAISGTFSKTGAGGVVYGYYNYGNPTGGTATFNANNFSNITLTGATSFTGIYHNTSTTQVEIFTNNIFSNITGGSGLLTGIDQGWGGASGTTVNGNTISGWTGSGSMTALYLGYWTGAVNLTVYNNIINGLITTGSSAAVLGMNLRNGPLINVFKNKIYNLQTTGASGTVYGIYDATGGATINIYNNLIGDLKAPAATNLNAINGIYASSTSTYNIFYNTIFLNATSSSVTTFGTSCVYFLTSGIVNMRNNILVNLSTPAQEGANAAANGISACLRRSGGTAGVAPANYATTSNNNVFWCKPSAGTNNHLTYVEGTSPVTNPYNTLAGFQAFLLNRDQNSFQENPTFVSTTGSDAAYLHINTGIATQIESGGLPINTPIAITTDYDGDTRNAATPDIGADEFSGIYADLTPPNILYTPLPHTSSLLARTLTATITDPSGVPTSGIGLPVLYWRINSGTYSAVTAISLGSNQYQFTFGNGVTGGDIVYYYICSQDNNSPPNVGAVPSVGAGGFTANPPAASIPTTIPSSYIIIGAPLSGDYTVGTTMFKNITRKNIYFEKSVIKVMKEVPVYEELSKENQNPVKITGTKIIEDEEISWIPMENGKKYEGELYIKKSEHPEYDYPKNINGVYSTITAAVTDLNLRGVSGPVRFLLTDASYTTETLPITIDITSSDLPTATNTVTFKPNMNVVASITGSSTASVFKLNGCKYIIIDGSNTDNGTTKDLTINNTATSGAAISLASKGTGLGAKVNTIKNCNVNMGANTSGTYVIYLTGNDNDSTTIQNNKIYRAYIGIYAYASSAGVNDVLNITGNTVGSNTGTEFLGHDGIYVYYANASNISNNKVFNIITTNTTPVGITLGTGVTNTILSKNIIDSVKYTGTGGWGARGMYISTGAAPSNLKIDNNFVSRISGDGFTSFSNSSPVGMYFDGIMSGLNIYYNSVFMSGPLTYSAATLTTAILFNTTTLTNIDVRDNIFMNTMNNGVNSSAKNYAIYTSAPNTSFTNINYNDYYVSGTQGVLGYLGGDKMTLALWQTATGKDLNSVSGSPKFLSNSNLHIDAYQVSPVDNAGQFIATVTNDIDGDIRNSTTPDIGADEYISFTSIPISPVLLLPANGSTGLLLTPTLTWDSLQGIFGYKVKLSTDSLFTAIVDSADVSVTQYVIPPGKLNPGIRYYWKVAGYNLSGTGTWSAIWNFKTLGYPSNISLLYPQNNSHNIPVSLTFLWTNAIEQLKRVQKVTKITKVTLGGDSPGILNYWFDISTDSTFLSGVITDSTLTDTTKFLDGLTNATTYFWRVKAKNQFGWGDYSEVWKFTTVLAAPVLTSPANGSIVVTLTPSLEWGSVIGASTYRVQVSPYSDFSSLTLDTQNITATNTIIPAGLLRTDSLYYWRANASNEWGTGAWSIIWNFRTYSTPVDKINNIKTTIDSMVVVGIIDKNDAFPLIVSLDIALKSIEKGNIIAAINELNAFINKVEALIKSHRLNKAQGKLLIDPAIAAIEQLRIGDGNTNPTVEIPKEYKIYQNYPNPFNPVTRIRVDVPKNSLVKVVIYDILGREIKRLVNEELPAGIYEYEFNASNLSSGIYFYRMETNEYVALKKMVLLK